MMALMMIMASNTSYICGISIYPGFSKEDPKCKAGFFVSWGDHATPKKFNIPLTSQWVWSGVQWQLPNIFNSGSDTRNRLTIIIIKPAAEKKQCLRYLPSYLQGKI